MKLKTFKRTVESKSEVKKLRRDGKIPGVVYFGGESGQTVYIDKSEFKKHLKNIKQGRLATTIFELTGEGYNGKVIVKDIQYDIISYEVIHLDFLKISDDQKITVNVPIECTGAVDCVGIKLGGVLRQVIRSMKVRCLSQNIPTAFQLNVKELGMKQSLRLGDVKVPDGVEPVADLNEVAVVIAKR